MRINLGTYVIEMYESNKSPADFYPEDVLRLIAYENGYTGFSSRLISKEVVNYIFEN